MKPAVYSVLAVIFVLTFAACASTSPEAPPPEPPPAWAGNLEDVFPNAHYLARRGTGSTVTEAMTNAAQELASHFRWEIRDSLRAVAVSQGNNPTETAYIEDTVIERGVELFSIRNTRPWYNRGYQRYETVVYINRAEAWQVFEPGVRREESAFLDMFNAAEAEGDALRRFMMLRGAQSYYAANVAPMRSFSERLHPAEARGSFPVADAALSALPRLIDEARSQAVIFIDSRNDFENRITQLVERTLNNEGFNVSRNRAEADAIFAVDFDFNMMENRTSQGTTYSFAPAVHAVLNGRSGVILSYHSPSLSRTVTLTQDAGRRRSFTAFMTALENSFPIEFRNSLASFAEGR